MTELQQRKNFIQGNYIQTFQLLLRKNIGTAYKQNTEILNEHVFISMKNKTFRFILYNMYDFTSLLVTEKSNSLLLNVQETLMKHMTKTKKCTLIKTHFFTM